jgi:pseudouridine kinase
MTEEFSPFPEYPVLVIGAAGIDIVGRIKSELQSASSNPARIRTSFGGVARNVAENLARLGQSVTLLTALGNDQAGDQLCQQISTAGVNTEHILKVEDCATGAYLAIINARGGLQYALDDMQATSSITPAYLKTHADLFEQASLLFLDGNLSKDALRTAISLAKQAGIPICADPTSTVLARKFQPHLSHLSLITPNDAEAGILCDRIIENGRRRQALEAAKQLVSQGVGVTIITLAGYGVCYATSETSGYLPAIRTEVIDPTGAGDAMTATILFALLNDIPMDDAVRLGVSAATLTLRFPGSVVADLSLEKLYDQLVI